MSALRQRFIDSIYYRRADYIRQGLYSLRSCSIDSKKQLVERPYIVATKTMVLIYSHQLHQPVLRELPQCQHQIIYQTRKMNRCTHVEKNDMAIRLICKSQTLELDQQRRKETTSLCLQYRPAPLYLVLNYS